MKERQPGTILVKNVMHLVSCDDADREHQNVDV